VCLCRRRGHEYMARVGDTVRASQGGGQGQGRKGRGKGKRKRKRKLREKLRGQGQSGRRTRVTFE